MSAEAIRVLALDVDGVLTNGEVTLDAGGRESKSLFFRDVDAVFTARRAGLEVVLVTGEDTPVVDAIARKLEVERVYRGHRDKAEAIRKAAADLGVGLSAVCYVGDAARDAEAFVLVGLALAPADAADAAKAAAQRILGAGGGRGAVEEAVALLVGGS